MNPHLGPNGHDGPDAPDPAGNLVDAMGIYIVELEKIAQSQAAITAAYRSGMALQERGWMRYPAVQWDAPAIVAMVGGDCVGGINYTVSQDDLTASVAFAFADPGYPAVFVRLLGRLRRKLTEARCTECRFTFHEGNEAMAKAAVAMRARLISHTYKMAL